MAYAYIPDAHRKGKLGKKAEKLRFIGYSLQAIGYRLIDEHTGRVVIFFYESDFQHDPKTVVKNRDSEVTVGSGDFPEEQQPGDMQQNSEYQEAAHQKEGQQENEAEQSHYPRRQRTVPVRYGYVDSALVAQPEEPQSITEALKSELSAQWREAANSEYQSLKENEMWELVTLPPGRNLLDVNGCSRQNRGVMERSITTKLV